MNIPGYEIFEVIGRGGSSIVYRAQQRSFDREVAVKVLREEARDEADERRRFLASGTRAANVIHPGSITVYETSEAAGHVFTAMELVHAGTLKDAIQMGMAEEDAVTCLLQICDALAAAHRAEVVHGDIKPHNILLRDPHQAVLTDYSGAVDEDLSEASHTIGSPLYISPEQVQGQPPSAASDIYSVGVLLYEILAGQPPFQGGSAAETALLHVNDTAPLLKGRYHVYNPTLQRMLAKAPEERYPSMAQAAYNIRRALKVLTEFDELPEETAPSLEPTPAGLQSAPLPADPHLHDTQMVPLDKATEIGLKPDMAQPPAENSKSSHDTPPPKPSRIDTATDAAADDLKLPSFDSKLEDTRTIPIIKPLQAEALISPSPENTTASAVSPQQEVRPATPAIVWLILAGALAYALWYWLPEAKEEFAQATQSMESVLHPPEPFSGAANKQTALELNSTSSHISTMEQDSISLPEPPIPATPMPTASDSNVSSQENSSEPALPIERTHLPDRAKEPPVLTADDLSMAMPGDLTAPLDSFELVEFIDELETPVASVENDPLDIDQSMEFSLAMHADLLTRHSNGDISLFLRPAEGYHSGVARLDQMSEDKLEQLNYVLRNHSGFTVQITDHRFSNESVSKKYSAKVSRFMQELGLPSERITLGSPSDTKDHSIELRILGLANLSE